MPGYLPPEHDTCFQLVMVTAIGAVLIVGTAALAARWISSAVWRRTIWQVATLALLALMLVELTGTGSALVRLVTVGDWSIFRPGNAVCGQDVGRERGLVTFTVRGGQSHFRGQDASSTDNTRSAAKIGTVPCDGAVGDWSIFRPRNAVYRQDVGRKHGPVTFAVRVAEDRFPNTPDAATEGPTPLLPPQQSVPRREPVPVAETVTRFAATSGLGWWPVVIWAMGAAPVVLWIAWSRLLLLAFRWRAAVMSNPTVCEGVHQLARRLGMRRGVGVLEADALTTPVAFGCLRPTVVLPVGFSEEFDRRQQETILAHELAHLAAGDPAWQFVADLLCAALWWHPLAWWSRRGLRAASEAAADEASLLVPDGPGVLAGCLVEMGRRLANPRRLGWLSVEGNGFRSSLGRRVERLLRLPQRPWRAPGRGRMVFAKTVLTGAMVVLAVSCTAWARPQALLTQGETTMKVLSESWRHSLVATAMLVLLGPASGDAVADQADNETLRPAAVNGDLLELGNLLALRDDEEEGEKEEEARERGNDKEGEREEGEARRRRDAERREHHQRAEREKHERAERERHERAERERHEHAERERHEHAERERHEHAERERSEHQRHREELMHERRKLEERVHELKRKLGEMGEERGDAGHEIEREIHEIQGRIRHIDAQMRGPEGERQQLRHRLEELKREIHRLAEAGKREQAERLEREARKIMQRLEGERRERPGPPRPEHGEDIQRRLHHVRVAIENLRAAGLHDAAEHLAREVERRVREAHERRGPHRTDRPEHPEHREGPPPPEHVQRVVHELRSEVQQLRREMHEIRKVLKRLVEEERREER